MGVQVDEAGRDDQPRRVEHFEIVDATSDVGTDADDAITLDEHVGPEARTSGPVDDRSTTQREHLSRKVPRGGTATHPSQLPAARSTHDNRAVGVVKLEGRVAPSRDLSRVASLVGVGESDYGADYKASRAKQEGYVPPDSLWYAEVAFERALADSGLRREDVDGVNACFMYDRPDLGELVARLGITPRYAVAEGNIMDDVLPPAVLALADGRCDTIALVYATAPRTSGRVFGGDTYGNEGATPVSYYYFTPWGWSSQAAHWAFIFQHYMNVFGATEADLGNVALTLRRHAQRNDNAIMWGDLSMDDYLGSRYIVRPLHLFDMCLVNNGGVCLILRRTDLAGDLPHVPVEIAGWGRAKVGQRKMHHLVRERLRPQFEAAAGQAYEMAGMARSDVGHFQGYDASTMHLVQQLEGYGFAEPGGGLRFFADGQADLDGSLPVNTSGGLLSEAYMHGWNHVVEAVRQLRHEAGDRQVGGVTTSLFSMATTDTAHPLLFTRGG
jgi:acetyl-CoA acetyltransferase